jgi:hypothetical protein
MSIIFSTLNGNSKATLKCNLSVRSVLCNTLKRQKYHEKNFFDGCCAMKSFRKCRVGKREQEMEKTAFMRGEKI